MLASLRNLLTQPAVFTSAIVGVLLVTAQQLGVLEHPELIVFDQMMQRRADVNPDPRLLIVAFTENDIQKLKQSSPNGNVLSTVLSKLEQYQAKVIGLDFFRDVPVEPGHKKLLTRLKQSSRIVSICKLGDDREPAVPPPQGVAPEAVGFADLLEDGDGVIRRNLLIASPDPKSKCAAQASLGFQLAINYLNVVPKFTEKGMQLGKTVFQPLEPHSGNYRNLDDQGFQILLNYGSRKSIAQEVSFTDVLSDRINPSLVKNRIVLIGTTAPSSQDIRVTPYSGGNKQNNSGKMAGVVIHAHVVSEILDAVSNKRRLFWFFPEWGEILWMWGWTLVGGVVAWRIQHPLVLGLATIACVGLLVLSCFAILTQAGWVPVVSPILGFLVAEAGVVAYTAFQNKQQKEKVALQIQEQKETISLLQALLRDGGSQGTQTQAEIGDGLQLQAILNKRYKIVELLGCGGFSYTYLAEDTHRPGNPQCVVKYLQPARKDEVFLDVARRLFKSEAEILEVLGQHEQIPQLMAYFEEHSQFYLVQEYIQGHCLNEELIPGKRFSDAQVVDFLNDVLQILEFVHSHGVIHRDIKPSNLMRREKDQRIVLIDFGAVKQIQPQHPTENPTVAVGTVGYAPPEQFMGQPRLNSDIYALGMIAIQALTGTPAKYLERGSTTELVWRHFAETTQELAGVLDKMVCFDFQKRYQSVEEVLYALQSF
ncbi:serine/threonine protein kinase with Chase2 sensor [Scytonema sp. HK-05]|uniref:CHASE2 domain-containing serine/threonine-protein kinase n=1 Tax=Scytonema sp. HK-05 TaxID=1137095 RepID=UPI0009362B65|nr:CHASE2 domain-containing serine/threonine-protein kinase [Scytonema sp. HK-05]OKH56955.1 serine/threonine protein kinase [Scytonema sp. HK-05]BAY45653.1 serine/threonine protein kinase with Chase2 sensor [Scytonema sp. HK-05]